MGKKCQDNLGDELLMPLRQTCRQQRSHCVISVASAGLGFYVWFIWHCKCKKLRFVWFSVVSGNGSKRSSWAVSVAVLSISHWTTHGRSSEGQQLTERFDAESTRYVMLWTDSIASTFWFALHALSSYIKMVNKGSMLIFQAENM